VKTILLIFGTRPEAIKMAPVIRELRRHSDRFRTLVCVTAQHRGMLDQVLQFFGIRPDFDLDIMRPQQDLYDITAAVLTGMRSVLDAARPDLVLVHGDTTTTMAATLAAFYAHIPVGHVEAGLRTGNKQAPFPEEVNRKVTGAVCDVHFAPTEQARQNLLAEGVCDEAIEVTGNTVIDALFLTLEKIRAENLDGEIAHGLIERFPGLELLFGRLRAPAPSRLILVTGHRRENFGDGFENICRALHDIAAGYPDVELLYPVHLNPNVQEPVRRILGGSELGNIHLIEPVDYLPFVWLMDRAYLIITDSGGVQEEAPSLGKPVLVMRDATERPEAVMAGTVKLVGTDREKIIAETRKLLDDKSSYNEMSRAHNPYGDGRAAHRIVTYLRS
jgi:UDP-N-acetylglucosamine 2-epimerase (non-hydrolysing)